MPERHAQKIPGLAADRLMILCAPNGARRQKSDHPEIPLAAHEIAELAPQLVNTGVSVLHLHVRDPAGGHTLDVDTYRRTIAAIRGSVGKELVIQVTSESVGMYSTEEQMAMVRELRPEAVSLALREICPDRDSEPVAGEFYRWLSEQGIWAQHILYEPEQFRRLERMRQAGILGSQQPSCLFVLGDYATSTSGAAVELEGFLSTANSGQYAWAACCFGPGEQAVMLAAAGAGGHVRLGFENNLWLPDCRRARNNTELVESFRVASAEQGRQAASAEEVRCAFFT